MTTPEPTDPDQGRSEPGPDATLHDIKADIETTRDELGQTVEALTAKLDVKHQAKQKVAEVTTDADGVVRPVVPMAALALLVVVIGILIARRRS